MEVTKKLNEYRVVLPADMLKELEIQKGDYINLKLTDEGILFSKSTEAGEQVIKPKVEQPKVHVNNNVILDEYNLKVVKRTIVNLPKILFDMYNLAFENFSTNIEEKDNKTILTLRKDKDGINQYRKINNISLNFIFPEFKFDEGTNLILKHKEDGTLILIFNMLERKGQVIYKKPVEKINKEVSKPIIVEQTPSDNYTVKVQKGGVITIPMKPFKEYNFSKRQYDPDLKINLDGRQLVINFKEDGKLTFPKLNALSIIKLSDPIKIVPGEELDLKITKNQIIIYFKDVEIKEETVKLHTKNESIMKPINQDLYNKKLEELKRSKSYLRIIQPGELSDEPNCSICGKKLTDKDNSMVNSHRVCNVCKRIELKKWFKPLYELAKLRGGK